MYDENFVADTLYNEEVILFYKKTLKTLRSEQAIATATKIKLETQLKAINIATEFEKRRRIKRAAFDNEDKRFSQDRATLENIKKTTPISSKVLTSEDFNTGEVQSNRIQILKNVNYVDNGYYLIIAVHTDKDDRDQFLTNVVASGESNIDFFFDVSTSKYYIYSKKFNSIEEANNALNKKGDKPYNTNMSLVKIEN